MSLRDRITPALARRRWLFGLALAALVGSGCAAPAAPPADPLAVARAWGESVRTYRYERTTVTAGSGGAQAVSHEEGAVVRPDRQHLRLRGATGIAEASREVIVVDGRAWARPSALGQPWQEMRAERLAADPLTAALGTLAAAGPTRDLGERQEEDGRRCRGHAYAFAPARAPGWPTPPPDAEPTAEATIWLAADGAICRQTVRLSRSGRPDAEYTVVLRDTGLALTIASPAP